MNSRSGKPGIKVSAALIFKDGDVLITRRPKGTHLEGLWEFPGGKKNEDESLEACLKREIMEELGMDILVKEHILTVRHEYEAKHVTLYFYACSHVSGEPEPREGQELKWSNIGDLYQYSFPPPDLQVVELLAGKNHK